MASADKFDDNRIANIAKCMAKKTARRKRKHRAMQKRVAQAQAA
jgi:hypothetical protein